MDVVDSIKIIGAAVKNRRNASAKTEEFEKKIFICESMVDSTRDGSDLTSEDVDFINNILLEIKETLHPETLVDLNETKWDGKIPDALRIRDVIGEFNLDFATQCNPFMVRGKKYLADGRKV